MWRTLIFVVSTMLFVSCAGNLSTTKPTFREYAIASGLPDSVTVQLTQVVPTNGVSYADADTLLQTQMRGIRLMVDPKKAMDKATDLQSSQDTWDNTSFYSTIILGSLGTVLTATKAGPIGAGVNLVATIVGAIIEKASQNPVRTRQLSGCNEVATSGYKTIAIFEGQWQITFLRYSQSAVPDTTMTRYANEYHTLQLEITSLMGKCPVVN